MKLDRSKLADSERIKAKPGVLPTVNKITPAEDVKEKAKTQDPSKEKAKKTAPVEEVKEKPEEKAKEVQKEEKKAEAAKEKEKASPVSVPLEKKKRGRPQIHPMKLNSSGEKLINTNCPLEEELQLFLEYACEMDGGVSKAAFIRKLVHNCYEKNFDSFHAWKRQRNKGGLML